MTAIAPAIISFFIRKSPVVKQRPRMFIGTDVPQLRGNKSEFQAGVNPCNLAFEILGLYWVTSKR